MPHRTLLLPVMCLLACPPAAHEEHDDGEHPVDHAPAPAPEVPIDGAVAYTVSLSEAHTHMVDITATWAIDSADEVVWMMPVWTPGSYLIREYARNVEGVTALGADGSSLPLEKVAKNRWAVNTAGQTAVSLRYRVYARQMSVRSSFVDGELASLVGASLYITPVDALGGPYTVQLELPEGWATSATGLPAHPDGAPHHYLAPDFDVLIDSPILAGNPVINEFEVGGKPHRLVNIGGGGVWDEEKSTEGAKAVTEVITEFWGHIPYDDYSYLNLVTGGGGGLEHLNSTLIISSNTATEDDDTYVRWLGLVSHEFFHTWNVKRLRPDTLGPFDYETERYTPSLWVAEGLTSYYDDLLLVRAGLMEKDAHLRALTKNIKAFELRPGNDVQPLSTASFDSWIKHYRPDENSVNTSVSYYNKGAVVGWLADMEIRRATNGRRSLDDVMRLAYHRYSGEKGYSEEAFRAVASEVAGIDMTDWFATTVDGTGRLPYERGLDWLGLRFEPIEVDEDDEPEAWLGIEASGSPWTVDRVKRGTPAWDAGINVGDEIIAAGELRLSNGRWDQVRKRHAPGDEVELLMARRGTLRKQTVTFGTEPDDSWTVEVSPTSTTGQDLRRKRWYARTP